MLAQHDDDDDDDDAGLNKRQKEGQCLPALSQRWSHLESLHHTITGQWQHADLRPVLGQLSCPRLLPKAEQVAAG